MYCIFRAETNTQVTLEVTTHTPPYQLKETFEVYLHAQMPPSHTSLYGKSKLKETEQGSIIQAEAKDICLLA